MQALLLLKASFTLLTEEWTTCSVPITPALTLKVASSAEPAGQMLRAPSHHDTGLVFAFTKSDISSGRAAHVEAIRGSTQRRASFMPQL